MPRQLFILLVKNALVLLIFNWICGEHWGLDGPPLLKKQSMIKYTFESTDNRKNRMHLTRNYDATDIDKTRLFTQVTVNAD